MNGDEVLLCLRKTHPHTPALVITAYPSVELEEKVKSPAYGAMRFLTKPVRPYYLIEAIRSGLNKKTIKRYARKSVETNPAKAKTEEISTRKKRQFEIIALIRKDKDVWTQGMLKRHFGCSKTQIHNDIKELQKIHSNLKRGKTGYLLEEEEKSVHPAG